MEKGVAKLKKDFPQKVFSGINACLAIRDVVSATILICCAIDLLAKYYSGRIDARKNRERYMQFLAKYFPEYTPPDDFYNFVRSGLVHTYNMEGRYLLINSSAKWAQDLNMQYDIKHKTVIINPYRLKNDLGNALKKYITDLESDKDLRKRIRTVYKKYPLVGQTMKISKFKYLKKE